jgi:hypothetical protein
MRSNHFDSTILGINHFGQGSTNAVEGTLRATLRSLIIVLARRLALRAECWCVLKRMPATATCPSYRATRWQRHQRWMSGVVVDPGTVGVC